MLQRATPARVLRARPTIRTRLTLVVLACALPAVLGVALLLNHFYERERAQLGRDTLLTARALVLAVDRDLSSAKTAALALATSRNIAMNDLGAFQAQAASLLNDEFPGFTFVLSDRSGQQLVNTLLPFGQPLPMHGNPEQLRRVFDSGRPLISDVYVGGLLRRPLISIDVPVWRDGKVVYDLSVGILPDRLGKILTEQRLPPERIAAIFDAKGVIVARTHESLRFVGQKGSPLLIERLSQANEGDVESSTLEGIPVYTSFSRSPVSGWSVAIGVRKSTVLGEMLRSVAWISLAVFALLAFGFLSAWYLGGKISKSVKALASPATGARNGEAQPMPAMSFREADEVWAELLRHRHHLEYLVDERTDQLEKSKALLETIYATAPVGLSFLGPDLRFVMVNQYFAALNGKPAKDHLGHTLPEVIGEIGNPIQQACQRVLETGQPLLDMEFSARSPFDPERAGHWIVNYYPVFGAAHKIIGMNGVVVDITARKAAEEEIAQLAFFDVLTGLPNRRLLQDRLRQALATSTRSRREGALMFIDLDDFKALNDSLGHDKGDLLLKKVAVRLSECVREADTVGRLGGDEFVVILEELSDDLEVAAAQAGRIGEKILATLNQPYDLDGYKHYSTASIGIALFHDQKDSVVELLKRADLAMYQAKSAGRNTLRFYDLTGAR